MDDETTQRWIAITGDGRRVAIDVRHEGVATWVATVHHTDGRAERTCGFSASSAALADAAVAIAIDETDAERRAPIMELLPEVEPTRAELLAALATARAALFDLSRQHVELAAKLPTVSIDDPAYGDRAAALGEAADALRTLDAAASRGGRG